MNWIAIAAAGLLAGAMGFGVGRSTSPASSPAMPSPPRIGQPPSVPPPPDNDVIADGADDGKAAQPVQPIQAGQFQWEVDSDWELRLRTRAAEQTVLEFEREAQELKRIAEGQKFIEILVRKRIADVYRDIFIDWQRAEGELSEVDERWPGLYRELILLEMQSLVARGQALDAGGELPKAFDAWSSAIALAPGAMDLARDIEDRAERSTFTKQIQEVYKGAAIPLVLKSPETELQSVTIAPFAFSELARRWPKRELLQIDVQMPSVSHRTLEAAQWLEGASEDYRLEENEQQLLKDAAKQLRELYAEKGIELRQSLLKALAPQLLKGPKVPPVDAGPEQF